MSKCAKLCDWVEENIEQTLSSYRLPEQHHNQMKPTNMLERLNQQVRRRTHVARIFPNAASCLRLIRTLRVEVHQEWIERMRYVNMDLVREDKMEQLKAPWEGG